MLQKQLPVHVELALRWWHENHCYFDFITIALQAVPNKIEGYVLEHMLIHRWQSSLNWPWIKQFKLKSLGMVWKRPTKRHGHPNVGCRLVARLSRHHRNQWRLDRGAFVSNRSLENMWRTIFRLSSLTRQSFEASKEIRSHRWSLAEVYALLRLSANCEEPHRSKVTSLIKKAIVYRKGPLPGRNVTVTIPFCLTLILNKTASPFLVLLYKQTRICLHRFTFQVLNSEKPPALKSHRPFTII